MKGKEKKRKKKRTQTWNTNVADGTCREMSSTLLVFSVKTDSDQEGNGSIIEVLLADVL